MKRKNNILFNWKFSIVFVILFTMISGFIYGKNVSGDRKQVYDSTILIFSAMLLQLIIYNKKQKFVTGHLFFILLALNVSMIIGFAVEDFGNIKGRLEDRIGWIPAAFITPLYTFAILFVFKYLVWFSIAFTKLNKSVGIQENQKSEN